MKSLDKKIIQEETFNDNNTELWCKKLKERQAIIQSKLGVREFASLDKNSNWGSYWPA